MKPKYAPVKRVLKKHEQMEHQGKNTTGVSCLPGGSGTRNVNDSRHNQTSQQKSARPKVAPSKVSPEQTTRNGVAL
ncbi:MAG: hypothetical protein U0103_28060 [Candidatus Obscuribacterales bacterium]